MDKYQKMKERLEKRDIVLGENWMVINSSVLAERANQEKIDFILLDEEHGVFNSENMIPMLQVCRLSGFPTIVRVPECKYHLIARVMDMGADGIMLPRTETVEQVKKAIGGMLFPPIGKTGCGGFGQFRPGEEIEDYQKNRFLFVQIESPLGMDNLPAMLEQYGEQISGIIIGPYDLSIALGLPKQFDHPLFLQTVQKIFDICRERGKSVGIYCDNEEIAKKYHAMGANILWVSSDVNMFMRGLKETFEPLYRLRKED